MTASKNTILLAGLAIAVAGAVAFLVISARSSAAPASSRGAASSDGDGVVAEAHAAERPDPNTPRRMTGETSGKQAADGVPRLDSQGEEYRDFVRTDGTRVRDHRTGNRADPNLEMSPHVRTKRGRLSPEVIVAVRRWLRPHVTKCSRDYERDIGEDAKVDVRVQVSITSGALTVGKTVINPKNVSGGDFAACIEQAVRTMELTVEHPEDVEHHMLTFPFGLPIK